MERAPETRPDIWPWNQTGPEYGPNIEELQLPLTMDGKWRILLTDEVLCTTNSKAELDRGFESEYSEDSTVVD